MASQQQQFETQGGATGYETGAQGIGGQQGQQPTMGGQTTGGQSTGQQMGGQQMGGGQAQQGGQTLESSLSGPMRLAMHDFVQSMNACEWCADQCIDHGPQMAECIRLCRDVADLASLNVQLMGRDSIFGPEAAQLFAEAAEECARECAQHPQSHCQECASVLRQAVESTRAMLSSFQQGGATGGQGGPGQMTQQPTQQGGTGKPGGQF